MLSYETLDTIADAYNPLLLIASVMSISVVAINKKWKASGLQLIFLLAGLMFAYGFMLIDNYFKLWIKFGADYSTHTAVALALVLFLSLTIQKAAAYIYLSLIVYFLLMLYQNYHTVTDIFSTILVILVSYGLILIRNRKLIRG